MDPMGRCPRRAKSTCDHHSRTVRGTLPCLERHAVLCWMVRCVVSCSLVLSCPVRPACRAPFLGHRAPVPASDHARASVYDRPFMVAMATVACCRLPAPVQRLPAMPMRLARACTPCTLCPVHTPVPPLPAARRTVGCGALVLSDSAVRQPLRHQPPREGMRTALSHAPRAPCGLAACVLRLW